MKLLLDTQAFLWFVLNDRALSDIITYWGIKGGVSFAIAIAQV
jgi:PIN domain nuclease of toxin-antitoxin system